MIIFGAYVISKKIIKFQNLHKIAWTFDSLGRDRQKRMSLHPYMTPKYYSHPFIHSML